MTLVDGAPRLTELQFQILNAMMDDAEDLEQIYLAANRSSLEAGSIQPEHPLRDIIDELNSLLKGAYVEAPKSCNTSLPLPPDSSLLHHYWFSPTEKGKQAWKAYKASPSGPQG
jgi:hypothetical protein